MAREIHDAAAAAASGEHQIAQRRDVVVLPGDRLAAGVHADGSAV